MSSSSAAVAASEPPQPKPSLITLPNEILRNIASQFDNYPRDILTFASIHSSLYRKFVREHYEWDEWLSVREVIRRARKPEAADALRRCKEEGFPVDKLSLCNLRQDRYENDDSDLSNVEEQTMLGYVLEMHFNKYCMGDDAVEAFRLLLEVLGVDPNQPTCCYRHHEEGHRNATLRSELHLCGKYTSAEQILMMSSRECGTFDFDTTLGRMLELLVDHGAHIPMRFGLNDLDRVDPQVLETNSWLAARMRLDMGNSHFTRLKDHFRFRTNKPVITTSTIVELLRPTYSPLLMQQVIRRMENTVEAQGSSMEIVMQEHTAGWENAAVHIREMIFGRPRLSAMHKHKFHQLAATQLIKLRTIHVMLPDLLWLETKRLLRTQYSDVFFGGVDRIMELVKLGNRSLRATLALCERQLFRFWKQRPGFIIDLVFLDLLSPANVLQPLNEWASQLEETIQRRTMIYTELALHCGNIEYVPGLLPMIALQVLEIG